MNMKDREEVTLCLTAYKPELVEKCNRIKEQGISSWLESMQIEGSVGVMFVVSWK